MPAVDGAYAKCTSAALAEVPDKEASLIDKTLVVQTNPISCHEQLLQAARLLAQQSRTYYLLMTGKPSVADASGCTRELVHYALQYHTCARNLIAACPTSRSKRLSGPCFLPLQSVRSVLSAGGALRLRASEVGLVEEAINHLDQLPVAAGAAAAQRMRENAETIADARQELKQESLTRISPTFQTPFPLCITGHVFYAMLFRSNRPPSRLTRLRRRRRRKGRTRKERRRRMATSSSRWRNSSNPSYSHSTASQTC